MCEVPATMNVVNVTCLMSTDFFPNNSPCSLLNVCITKREQNQATFRYQMINVAADLSRNGLNLILNNICARA